MKKVFGIDLGTTYSCIAYIDEFGQPTVLKNIDGEMTTPSVVMVESENNIIVGEEAKRSVEIEPDKTVQFIKRKMGKKNDTVILNGKEYTAPEISAYILKKLVKDANEELLQTGVLQPGEEINDAVITCPAYFGMNERQATKTAGELAGLNVLSIINEPTAAAISYGVSHKGEDETVLIYDLGGGTFDITVMNIHNGNFNAICTDGDDQLGGKDWDEKLMKYVMERYEEEFGENLSDDEESKSALYEKVEGWKKSLSSREKINVTANGPDGRIRDELTREKYEELTVDLLNRTKNLVDKVLNNAEVLNNAKGKKTPIDRILLVGGSSMMPQVRTMLEQYKKQYKEQYEYKLPIEIAEPNLAVAKGAAIFAANEKAYKDFLIEESGRTGKTIEELEEQDLVEGELTEKFNLSIKKDSMMVNRLKIHNVISRSYGISAFSGEGEERRIYNILMINSKLPANASQMFATHEDNQTAVELPLYETRSEKEDIEIGDYKPITTFEMNFNKSVPKGTEIAVELMLDNSGLIHIKAEEMLYHSKLNTTFQLSNQMTKDEMSTAIQRTLSANVE